MNRLRRIFLVSLIALSTSFVTPAWAFGLSIGKVFTMTNAADGNQILVFNHRPLQGLVQTDTVDSGGNGTGAGLGNQGGLVLSDDGHWLIGVNAGSNSVSVFLVLHRTIHLVDTVDSGGEKPVSVTQHHNLVYVLNAGSDSIAGFTMAWNGKLTPLADSVRGLSGAGTGPAQIGFSPLGDMLVVTEKATNSITTFVLDGNGVPGSAVVNSSEGPTPFGFAFDRYGHLLVTEAAGGAEDASSLSSYEMMEDGTLTPLASSVPTTETAACWVETSRNGRFAFTTNTGSSSISAYMSEPDGSLMLTNADGVAATTGDGSAPIDLARSRDGHFLFTLSASNGTILVYALIANRWLVALPGVAGLPTTLNGMATF